MTPHRSRERRPVVPARRLEIPLACAFTGLALGISTTGANAQQAQGTQLPPIVIVQPAPKAKTAPAEVAPASQAAEVGSEQATGFPGGEPRAGALTVPTTEEAIRELATVPGTVTVVTDDYKDTTAANTIKDALDYVPGVFVQPKWGDDTRLVHSRLRPLAQFPSARH